MMLHTDAFKGSKRSLPGTSLALRHCGQRWPLVELRQDKWKMCPQSVIAKACCCNGCRQMGQPSSPTKSLIVDDGAKEPEDARRLWCEVSSSKRRIASSTSLVLTILLRTLRPSATRFLRRGMKEKHGHLHVEAHQKARTQWDSLAHWAVTQAKQLENSLSSLVAG
eukprot:CAMPEP_0170636940 /NCGR_PEP_ID=MMETSP0224-20130122/38115_1 /TAXON_ID=285029 /ORGANISM="Togula jolla, Strain CCCM 725" /LENGTH=165 /DNA_ID=CAMNT_0010966725 /DNA_START=206 /DNA_END=704 /DNA_ORIENTATION=+